MRKIKLASPLFIVRDDCAKDLYGSLRRLAAIGFDGVEFLGFFGHAPSEIRKELDGCGLRAVGNHIGLDGFYANTEAVLDAHEILGCKYINVGGISPDGMPGGSDFAGTVAKIAALAEASRRRGIVLLYHNHADELLSKTGGVDLLEALADGVPAEDLKLEPDLGLIAIGCGDVMHYLDKYKNRFPVLHLKDFYADGAAPIDRTADFLLARGGPDRGRFEFRPTGYGIMNYPALLEKCLACVPEWIVADHDFAYKRDSYDDLRLSLEFLKSFLQIGA